MAKKHIRIVETASPLAAEMKSCIIAAVTLRNRMAQAKAVMDEVTGDTHDDFQALADYLGTNQNEAQAIYPVWGSATNELKGAFLSQLTARCG